MPKPEQPLLAGVKEQIGGLGGELREMAALRWRLARLELQSDLHAGRRFAVAAVLSAVMVLASLPVLVGAAADALDQSWGISRAGWCLILGLVLLVGGIALGWLAWRRFRRLAPLEQTREELREDLVWLREWFGTRAQGGGESAEGGGGRAGRVPSPPAPLPQTGEGSTLA
jgi:uncharacterized membrane protein YqjE